MTLTLRHDPVGPRDYVLVRDGHVVGNLVYLGREYVRAGSWAPNLGTEAGLAELQSFPRGLGAAELLFHACRAALIDLHAIVPDPADDPVLILTLAMARAEKDMQDRWMDKDPEVARMERLVTGEPR